MTSKDVISRLIDEHLITGEEAYVLMNDILRGEMTQVLENLQSWSKEKPEIFTTNPWNITSYTYTTDDTGSNTHALASSLKSEK